MLRKSEGPKGNSWPTGPQFRTWALDVVLLKPGDLGYSSSAQSLQDHILRWLGDHMVQRSC